MIILSDNQQQVLNIILRWYKNEKETKPYITLGGYAGTGKTTLIGNLKKELEAIDENIKIGFISYTGKASRVLRSKLQDIVTKRDTISTIHSLIYSPMLNDREEIIGWQKKDTIDRNLIIVDEASMVDGEMWRHLRSFNVPIIAVGDHGQLPPISGTFNLMEHPQLRLEEIYRQAKLNPIIGLSIQAREHGMVRRGIYSDTVKKYTYEDSDMQEQMNELITNYNKETLILCGYNTTRIKINNHIRQSLGFETPEPKTGDRIICLRNNHKKQIFNGMIGTIESIESVDEHWYKVEVSMDGEEHIYKGLIAKKQFNAPKAMNYTEQRALIMHGDLFDFGYALTVHKAQGSQSKRVILFEERFKNQSEEDWKRWLYTGITRAEEELYMFGS